MSQASPPTSWFTPTAAERGVCRTQLTTHDSRLTTHDSRLTTHDSRLTTHDSRLSTHDARLTTHDSRLTTHDSRLTTHDSRLTTHDYFYVPQHGLVLERDFGLESAQAAWAIKLA